MHLSASQISTFRDCQRKWAWRKLDGLRLPPNKHAELGIEVHEILEHWGREGRPIDPETRAGKIALAGLKHLPPPGQGTQELKFKFEHEGITYVGKIDHYEAGFVLDHKTTSDLKWAKTPEQLSADEQTIIYGFYAEGDPIDFKWVYYRTRGAPKSKPVTLSLGRDHIAAEFDKLHTIGKQMAEIEASGARALDLPPSMDICDKYGGCAYVDNCALTSTQRMTSAIAQHTNKENTMGLKLKDRLEQHTAKTPEPAAAPTAPKAAAPKAAAPTAPKAAAPTAARGINPPAAKPEEIVREKLSNAQNEIVVMIMSPAQLREMFDR